MEYSEKLKMFEKIVTELGIERKGKTMPYTSANGHMFSQLNKDGELGIRFSENVKEQYIRELETAPYTSYGSVMQGYVLIPENFWQNPEKISELLQESRDYIMTLDPK